jgi:hypothetical protein
VVAVGVGVDEFAAGGSAAGPQPNTTTAMMPAMTIEIGVFLMAIPSEQGVPDGAA